MARPLKSMFPALGVSRPIRVRAMVVLPQPDSPTMASTSPRRSVNETPSTALMAPPLR
jgi:hypothetical protein